MRSIKQGLHTAVNPLGDRRKFILNNHHQKALKRTRSIEKQPTRTSNTTSWNWHSASAPICNFMFARYEQFVSIFTNYPTDRKYQFDATLDDTCSSPKSSWQHYKNNFIFEAFSPFLRLKNCH